MCVLYTHPSPCPSRAPVVPAGRPNATADGKQLQTANLTSGDEGVPCALGLVEAIFLLRRCRELLRRWVLGGD